MPELKLETITENLADGYQRLEKGTFQEASEIQFQRRSDNSLRNKLFYTANLPVFRMNKGVLEYGLSGRKTFDAIAGADIQDFSAQILKNGIYRLTQPQIRQLEELDSDIVWAKADDLKLKKENDEWSYFLISTSDLKAKKLNKYQRLFAAKVHGNLKSKHDSKQKLSDYGETMKMLQPTISQSRIWLPTQDYISQYTKDGIMVARASWLYLFDDVSDFGAGNRNVDYHLALRGVQIKVGEADEKISTEEQFKSAYALLKANPERLTPEIAAGLSQIVTSFLSRKQ